MWFKKLLGSLIYSNIYLAIGAGIVSITTAYVFNLLIYSDLFKLFFIPFSGAFFIYNFNRLTDVAEDKINVPQRVDFVKKYQKYLLSVAVVLYMFGIFIAFVTNIPTFIISLVPGISALVYSQLGLKKVLLIKNLLVALSWGLSSLLVGAYYSFFGLEIFLTYIFFSLAFLVNVIIFDIKDIIGDKLYHISTLPVKLGIGATKKFCIIISILMALVSILLFSYSLKAVITLPFIAYILFYVKFAEKKENVPWWYYGGFVDGEFLILVLIMLLW